MNVENVKRAISVMKSVPEDEFDMRDWHRVSGCGTVACFAGHLAMSLTIPEIYFVRANYDVTHPVHTETGFRGAYAVGKFLDIESPGGICGTDQLSVSSGGEQHGEWFSEYYGKPLRKVTTKDVIEKLEQILEFGHAM